MTAMKMADGAEQGIDISDVNNDEKNLWKCIHTCIGRTLDFLTGNK